ncbi:MAG: hypothetical protein HUU32_22935 [Calditrichaceae bacterium]|nr:hypothetical protein [Calditrichaceae bacterium]
MRRFIDHGDQLTDEMIVLFFEPVDNLFWQVAAGIRKPLGSPIYILPTPKNPVIRLFITRSPLQKFQFNKPSSPTPTLPLSKQSSISPKSDPTIADFELGIS